VSQAHTAADAFDELDDTIGVILLDRNLPDMSGDEVLKTLREEGYEVPVAMVTVAEPDSDIIGMEFDEYLTKPVDGEQLVKTVRVLANRSSFEEKSREFFRLAVKQASLNTTEGDARDESLERLLSLQDELDDTIRGILAEEPTVVSHSMPSREETESILENISEHELPREVHDLIEDYQALKGARSHFMWKWVHQLAPQNTLPSIYEDYDDETPIDKTLAILFVTLLDDLLERNNDRPTFNEIKRIPQEARSVDPHREDVDTEYVEFALTVWDTLLTRLGAAPNFSEYEELLRFDIRQGINAIEYSEIAINQPGLVTMGDLNRYESHNMVMQAYADIDLMYSPIGTRDELPTIREAVWTAQLMARIGNWVSTWERELREGDFSSGVVVYALEENIVSRDELVRARENSLVVEELVDRIKDHDVEKTFLLRWEQHYHELREHNARSDSIDLEPFIEGTEEVLRYHLASTGLK